MNRHLDEALLEALSHGRSDLVSPEQAAHVDACAACAAAVEEARSLSRIAGAALSAATPEAVDLDELVRSVVAAAPALAPVPRASTRSLWIGALAAAPIAMVLGLASLVQTTSLGAVLGTARDAWTVAFTLLRLALVHLSPTVGATVAAVGALVIALLAIVIRALVGGAAQGRPAASEVVR